MRDAESALDQLISFCGDAIVEQDVLSMFGLTAQSQILNLAGGIFNGDAETVLGELNQLARQGKDLGRLLSDLMNHCRNVLIHLVSRGDASLLEVTEAELESINSHATLVDADTLTRIMGVLTDAEGRFRDAASKKIFFEITLLRAIQMRDEVPIEPNRCCARPERHRSMPICSRAARPPAATPFARTH
jgi:DNA polymerase-3 subunit gamma/tau